MKEVLLAGSRGCVAVAVLVVAVGVPRTLRAGRAAPATLGETLRLALEFLLAAGLLRLALRPGLALLGVTLGIIVIRQVIARGVAYAARTSRERTSGSLAPWRRAPASTSPRR